VSASQEQQRGVAGCVQAREKAGCEVKPRLRRHRTGGRPPVQLRLRGGREERGAGREARRQRIEALVRTLRPRPRAQPLKSARPSGPAPSRAARRRGGGAGPERRRRRARAGKLTTQLRESRRQLSNALIRPRNRRREEGERGSWGFLLPPPQSGCTSERLACLRELCITNKLKLGEKVGSDLKEIIRVVWRVGVEARQREASLDSNVPNANSAHPDPGRVTPPALPRNLWCKHQPLHE